LDVFVPSEEIVELLLLFVCHFNDSLIEFGEHNKVSKCEVVPHEEGAAL
jgi:hypothetical protein